MESHNSCEKLVDAEAGLANLKTPKNLSFVTIPRKRGCQTNFINYFFILFGIGLIALVFYEIWQTVRSEKLIKQIQIQDEEKQNDEFLWRMKKIEEEFDQQNTIPATNVLRPTTSVRLEADDTEQYKKSLNSFMEIPLDSSSLKIIDEDVIQGSDDSGSSVPVMIASPIDETELGRLWIIHLNFGQNSGDNNTIESEDTETIPLIKEDATEEGWRDYIHRMLFNPFATKFGMSWRWTSDNSSKEDNQSLESAEYEEDKIDSIETEIVTDPVVTTINPPSNYDYIYEDYSNENEEYETVRKEESTNNSDEDLDMTIANFRPDYISEVVKEVIPSTSTEAPLTSEFPSVYENTDQVSQYDSFGEKTEQGAEDGSTGTEVTTKDFSNDDHIWIEAYFRKLSEKRMAEVALLEKLYSRLQGAEKYSDYVTEKDYDDDSSNSSQLIISTKASQDSSLEPSLASTVEEDSKEEDFSTSTEAPQISESTTDNEVLYDNFWKTWLERTSTTEKDSEDRSKSDDETPEVLSKQDDPLSEYDDFLNSTTFPWGYFDEYPDYIEGEYDALYDDGPSYIAKRSVDTSSALEIPSEPLSMKEYEQKMSILRDAIDQENHFLMNQVSLTSGPTKKLLQSKMDNFHANMELVSAHIDRLHERYLRLNKLNDDYVSRELPAEEVDIPSTPIN